MTPTWMIITILIGLPLAWVIGIATGYRLRQVEEKREKDSG